MNAELIAGVEFWEKEKGISRDRLFAAIQESLLAAAKKAVGPARELRVTIDAKTGDIQAWAKLIVAERVLSKHDQISLFDARRIKPNVQLGDEIEKEVTPAGFGRIAAQFAKQALLQQVRRAEKELVFSEFKDREGDIVSGTVRRFERSDVYLDLGKFEAVMPNRERVPTEEYQIGERIRAYVRAVEKTERGPEIILSRAAIEFVVKLFQLEVAELTDGTIEIKAMAREPGFRTKLAVFSRDPKVDPVGACVGMRGQRVKNIVRELNNEKVDIFPWSADIRQLVSNALNPARLRTVKVDESRKHIVVTCAMDQLSLAIGKRGHNTRLTERLTGWKISVEGEEDVVPGFAGKVAHAEAELATVPGISPEHAKVLVQSGFHSVAELAEVEAADLAEIPGIGDAAGTILIAAQGEMARRKTEPAAA